MKSALVFVLVALVLCFDSAKAAEKVDWWESAILYQIYPRSFMDSNGDGVGDFNGITSRLKYLKDIGVTAAWLSPIFESPMRDMGYDVSNFTNVDPLFGTLEDFDNMVKEAHRLGLKVVLDFVPNHSSDQCEWFQKSVRREPGYEDFYVWDDGKIDEVTGKRVEPSNWISRFNGSAWTWNEERQQYYYHLFLPEQPDFNLRNPVVRQRLLEVMEFWLDRGVDSFRLDAVNSFFEYRLENGTYPDTPPNPPSKYPKQVNHPDNDLIMYEWREFLDNYQKKHGGDTRATFSEAYSPVHVMASYVGNGTHVGVNMPMNLNFTRDAGPITAKGIQDRADMWMNEMWRKHKIANWVTGNHDNGRVGSLKGYNVIDAITIVFQSLPGTFVTYYGEEIGMTNLDTQCTGVRRECDFRDPQRSPMQWDTSFNAGFSTANKTWLAVNPNHKFINTKSEHGVHRSNLEIYKGMAKLRKTSAFMAFKEEGGFSYEALNNNVFHIVRTNNCDEEYRILANFGNQLQHVEGLTDKVMEYVLLNSYSPHKEGEKADFRNRVYLRPYEAVVFRWHGKKCDKSKSKKNH